MNSRVLCFVVASIAFQAQLVQAETQLAFPEIWKRIKANSPVLKQKSLEREEMSVARARTQKQKWVPRVMAGASLYSTNDPGTTLFNQLGQRSVTANDFSPATLNHPERKTYTRSSVLADWAIYEGGMRSAAVEARGKFEESKELESRFSETQLYALAAQQYQSILVFENQHTELQNLESLVERVLSRYQVGLQGNPVGYSGLLGLKGLKNRIAGLLEENRFKRESLRASLEEMSGGLPADWSPSSRDQIELKAGKNLSSLGVRSMQVAAQGWSDASQAEKARWLPRVGVFGEGAMTRGDRSTGSSTTGGVYLQWELFSGDHLDAYREAQLKAQSAEARAEAKTQEERTQRAQLESGLRALSKQRELLSQSSGLLDEQIQMSQKLFLSGSINALQLTEVLSRRADLSVSRAQAETQWVESRANQFVLTGGQHE